MARTLRFGLLALACAASAVVAVLLVAQPAGADGGTTGTTPTSTDPTSTTPTTTTPTETTPTTPTPPGPRVVRDGVTIAGQEVGGLTRAQATAAVTKRFSRSFPLVVSKNWSKRVTPAQLGARALVDKAVDSALAARTPGAAIPLTVEVDDGALQGFVRRLGRETRREPRDAQLHLVHLAPEWSKAVMGRRLQESTAFYGIRLALRLHERDPYPLPFREVAPKVTDADPGKVIVIRRGSNQLRLYDGSTLKRVFRVATGRSGYPTPLGRWQIVNKQRNPWWYPPQGSAWAQGAQPVPPGPGNPLGTRWMGLSAPLVGIHGTPDAASIGYSASHGCIRMLIPQAEWLFDHVDIGTPVFIVPA